jgi:hypothetical protein
MKPLADAKGRTGAGEFRCRSDKDREAGDFFDSPIANPLRLEVGVPLVGEVSQ